MNSRVAIIGGMALLVAAGLVGFWSFPTAQREADLPFEDIGESSLPLPPVPPRIADGPDYERCLEMIDRDPVGAAAFADAWDAKGGGDGALHCHALARIADGDPEDGAEALEALAQNSQAPALARASVYDQATQIWLSVGEPDRAYAAATAALALAPGDPDRLIARSAAAVTLSRYSDAIADLNRALDLDPRRVDALVQRAAAWREEDKLDRAKEDVGRALALNPDYPDGLLERGIQRQRLGDDAGARADWERTIALDPDSVTADLAHQNLALLDAGPARTQP